MIMTVAVGAAAAAPAAPAAADDEGHSDCADGGIAATMMSGTTVHGEDNDDDDTTSSDGDSHHHTVGGGDDDNVMAILQRLQMVPDLSLRAQALAVVAAGLEAASLLVPQGAFLPALDVLEELKAAAEGGAAAGLHAFRSLPQQLAVFAQVSTPGT